MRPALHPLEQAMTTPRLAILALALLSAAPPQMGNDHHTVLADDIKWVDGPDSLPKGSQMAVLDGDPSKNGPFVLRAKMPNGFRIMPHTHPTDERVTVLRGTLHMGMGAKFDEKSTKAMPAGAYGRMGAGVK